jgi:hypothetical protein
LYLSAEGTDGEDQLLVDPLERGTGEYTAVKPLRTPALTVDCFAYEVKEGGENKEPSCSEIETRAPFRFLPRGYLRGFAFAPTASFYYVQETIDAKRPFYRAAYHHVLGTPISEDREVFFAGEDEKMRLGLFSDGKRLVFLVYRFLEKTFTDIYLKPFAPGGMPEPIFRGIDYSLASLTGDRILPLPIVTRRTAAS